MMTIKNYIICLAASIVAFMAVSCNDYDLDEVLLGYDDISLSVKGELQYEYDPLRHQYGYNSNTGEFRAYDDKLSDWFCIQCASVSLETGETVMADLEYTAQNTTRKYEGLMFVVKKISSEGYVWLWNDAKKIGVVVRLLE